MSDSRVRAKVLSRLDTRITRVICELKALAEKKQRGERVDREIRLKRTELEMWNEEYQRVRGY